MDCCQRNIADREAHPDTSLKSKPKPKPDQISVQARGVDVNLGKNGPTHGFVLAGKHYGKVSSVLEPRSFLDLNIHIPRQCIS